MARAPTAPTVSHDTAAALPPGRGRRGKLRAAFVALVCVGLSGTAGGVGDGELDALLETAAAHYQARRYFQAMEVFEKALEASNDERAPEIRGWLARALGMLGIEYFNSGELGPAEETFQRSLEYAEDFYARFGLGYIHFLRLDDVLAEKHLREALRQRPLRATHGVRNEDLARTHKVLALIEYRKGESQQALEELAEAVRWSAGDKESAALEKRWRVELAYSSRFKQLESSSFVLRLDPALSAAATNDVRRELALARDVLGERLGLWPSRQVAVVVFSDATFHTATGSVHWVGGLYDGQLKLPVPPAGLADEAKRSDVRRTIRHEYTHALIREAAPACPVWLNEGLAQYMEGPVRREALLEQLRAGRDNRLPFARVPARLWDVENESLARWTYLQGLGFVDFLARRFREFRLRLLLSAMAEESSVNRAFERTYGRTLEALEDDWWAELLGGSGG